MKKISHSAQILCFGLLFFCLSCQHNEPSSQADESTNLRSSFIPEPDLAELIIDLNTGMEEAFNKGDMKELAAFYSDRAILLGPGDYQIEGLDAIQAYWNKITNPVSWNLSTVAISRKEAALYQTETYKKMLSKPPDWKAAVGDRLNGKDIVYQLGHSTLKYKSEPGELNTSEVDFILLWGQQPDGTYKIVVDTYGQN